MHTKRKKEIKRKAQREGLKQIKETCKNKLLHGHCPQQSQQAYVDQANIHQWFHSVGLKAETVGFITVAQDQSLYSRNYQVRIRKMKMISNVNV